MAPKLHLLPVLTLILLLNCFCEGSWWNPTRSKTFDRSLPPVNGTKPEIFQILPVDRTTFLPTNELWLHQIDMTKIFTAQGNRTSTSAADVTVKVKIVQMQKSNRELLATVFVGTVNLNSVNEAKITFKDDILLKSENMYEIRLFMPALHFVYSENLSTAPIKIRRIFGRSIVLSFFPSNVLDTTWNGKMSENDPSVSVGLVKRLHVKYTKF